MNVYLTDGTEEGFYTAAFYACTDAESTITSQKNVQLALDARVVETAADAEKCARVKAKLRACDAHCLHEFSLLLRRGCAQREEIALAYLRLIVREGRPVRDMLAHPAVLAARENIRKVTGEAHNFTGFLRFMEGEGGIFYGPFEPDNDILTLILPHFMKRFSSQPFVIHDVRRAKAALCNGGECAVVSTEGGVSIPLSEREEYFIGLWKQYYRSVNIEQRPHEKQMKGYMPVRYWKYMPEKKQQ